MEPLALTTVLSNLIAVGLRGAKALDAEGVGEAELDTLKAFLDGGSSILKARSKKEPRVAALQLGLTAQAFGLALARHWAGNTAMVPGSTSLPALVAKWWDQDEHARRTEIELRTQQAALQLQVLGDHEVGVDEIALLGALTGQPDATPYYRALWKAFSNPDLGDSPLDLSRAGAAREFERHFRLAYAELAVTSQGSQVRDWLEALVRETPDLMREVLARDLASWGARHVFGNVRKDKHDAADPLPFMSLEDTYVEPLGQLAVEGKSPGERPTARAIQALVRGLLQEHMLVVVTADFGHGKSLSARRLASDLAREYIESQENGRDTPYPVFVKCVRDVQDRYDHKVAVRTALWNTAKESMGPIETHDFSGFSPPEGRQATHYVLDGLDELAFSPSQLESLFARLSEGLTQRHRAVVFTRPGALSPNCLPKGTPRVELRPFDPPRVQEWLDRWGKLPDQRALVHEQIPASLRTLAGTPILLLMIAMTWDPGQSVEGGQADLYEKFFRQIALGKHEADGDGHPMIEGASARLLACLCRKDLVDVDEQDTTQAMLWMMSRVAWKAHVLAARSEELKTSHVETILADELGLPPDLAPQIKVGLLVALQYHPGGGSSNILFGHQSFREFLVARFWCSQLRRLDRRSESSIEESLMESRLLRRGDRAFDFLREMLGDLDDRVRVKILDWAERRVNDEGLKANKFRADRTNWLRESALAIGSVVSKAGLQLDDPKVLRSMFAWFQMMSSDIIVYAPRLQGAGADFSGESLVGANLVGASLSEANLRRADLSEANLVGANLRLANLDGAKLDGAKLDGAYLFLAKLFGASLVGANLQGANLQGAKLPNADLQGADLQSADLQGANLVGANLQDAKLQGVNPTDIYQLRSATNYPEDPERFVLGDEHVCDRQLRQRVVEDLLHELVAAEVVEVPEAGNSTHDDIAPGARRSETIT